MSSKEACRPTHAIGIDVGGTTIKAIVASRDGRIDQTWRVPTPQDGADSVVAGVADLVARIESELESDTERVLTSVLTVAVPGIVDDDAGLAHLSVNLGWEDYPMQAQLSAALGREMLCARCLTTIRSLWIRASTAAPVTTRCVRKSSASCVCTPIRHSGIRRTCR